MTKTNNLVDVKNEDPIHSAVLLVEYPRIKWKGTAGMADGKNEIMINEH